MKEIRSDEYSVLKVIGTVLVITAHVTNMYARGSGAIEMPENNVLDYLTVFIYAFHMPLFMFLSGAIYNRFIRNGKYKDIKQFAITKAKRLMIPYLFFGIVYVSPVMVLLGITDLSLKEYIVNGILLGSDTRHLWYLGTLFALTIFARLFEPVRSARPSTQYVLLSIFIVCALRYWLLPNVFLLQHIAGNACYFIFGIIFDQKKELWDKILSKYWYCSIAAFIVILYTVFFPGDPILYVITGFLGIFMCYPVVLQVKDKISKLKIYKTVLNNSMGLYLFHPMIIYFLFYIGKDANINPYIFSIGVFTISSFLSYFATCLLRRIKLGVLLGE